ncbi:MAG: hypothetical protein U9Q69_06440 [Nanoarchaeota archaeon]|nr:hypothetical protein [Nanoarchaeota archaeon]
MPNPKQLMIVYLYGLLDIATSASILLARFVPSMRLITIVFGIIILLKALVYIKDFDLASMLDIIASVFVVLAAFNHFSLFTYIFMIWIFQKGIRSFL